jgi:Zn-dependent peptidase ImmA (M78 family)/transcriptional regulator with XRE-family HTH domain
MTIGNKLRQRRLSLGYTLDELRELILNQGVTISKASLSKYELDKSVPKATNLYSVAKALNTTPDYFLKKTDFQIKWIAFRKNTNLTKTEEERIKYIAKEMVEANFFLNDLLGKNKINYNFPTFSVSTYDEIEQAADSLRSLWNMDNWPIDSITNLLEEKSVSLVDVESTKGFDGLSGRINNEIPLIITIGHNSVDRKRMSIAHELGHLILKPINIDEEKAAFRFAAAFLAPSDCIKSKLGVKRKNIDIRELLLLKEEYGISIQALIRRCYDLKIITEYEYKRLNIYMRSNGMYKNEPGICPNKEVPIRIKSNLLRVVSEGLTTESEVISRFPNLSSELEGDDMSVEWTEIKPSEQKSLLQAAAENIASEYEEDGDLSGFELYDDILEN